MFGKLALVKAKQSFDTDEKHDATYLHVHCEFHEHCEKVVFSRSHNTGR